MYSATSCYRTSRSVQFSPRQLEEPVVFLDQHPETSEGDVVAQRVLARYPPLSLLRSLAHSLAHLLVPGYATLVSSPRGILGFQHFHRSSQLATWWQ